MFFTESRIVDKHGNHDEKAEIDELYEAWNTRYEFSKEWSTETNGLIERFTFGGVSYTREKECRIVDIMDDRRHDGMRIYKLSCGHWMNKFIGEHFFYCDVCGAKLTNLY